MQAHFSEKVGQWIWQFLAAGVIDRWGGVKDERGIRQKMTDKIVRKAFKMGGADKTFVRGEEKDANGMMALQSQGDK